MSVLQRNKTPVLGGNVRTAGASKNGPVQGTFERWTSAQADPVGWRASSNGSEQNLPGVQSDSRAPCRRKTNRATVRHDYKSVDTDGFSELSNISAWICFNGGLQGGQSKDLTSVETEIKQMVDMQVFQKVNLKSMSKSQLQRVIRTKMFTVDKFSASGVFVKQKSRLVALGFMEFIPVQYDISSPTVRFETLMLLLNIAAIMDWDIDQFDIKGAFLNAIMPRNDVFVSLNEDLTKILLSFAPKFADSVDDKGRAVLKLNKCLYGLKESSMEFYKLMKSVLMELGFQVSKHDQSLFFRVVKGVKHYVVIHVDDLLSFSSSRELLDELIQNLEKRFKDVTLDRNPEHLQYIGLDIQRNRQKRSMFISQPGMTSDVMENFDTGDEEEEMPYDSNLFGQAVETLPTLPREEITKFKSKLMQLVYLCRTRPDIRLPLAFLTTRMEAPTQLDIDKLTKVARYVNGTRGLGVTLSPTSIQLHCSADASFAINQGAKGQSGIIIQLGGGLLHASSNRQKLVTLSTAESELVALSSAVQEIVWMRGLLEEIGFKQSAPTICEQDNKSTVVMATRGSGRGGKSRSINVRHFWMKEKVEDGTIELVYTPSEDIIADGMTKALTRKGFLRWRSRILGETVSAI
jgi:hypothetical protein